MKNKLYKTLILTSVLVISVFSSKGQNTKFQRIIGGTGDERSYSMSQTKDGGYILAGYTTSNGAGKQDAYLIKTDGLGKVLWNKTYGTTGDDVAWKVKQTSDSGYIVVGTTSSNKGDGLMFKTNPNGNIVWSKYFNSDSAQDVYNVLESRFNNDIYVTGYIKTDSAGKDAFLAKYSSSGTFIWQRNFGGLKNEEGYSLVEDFTGAVAVVGVVVDDAITIGGNAGVPGDEDFFIARFNSKGDSLCFKNYGSTGNDQIWDIKYSKGQYIATGWTNGGPGSTDVLLSIIDTLGNIKNTYTYNLGGSSRAFSLIVNPDESYSITGYAINGTNGRDAFYLNTNNTGVINALNFFGGASTDGHWPSEITRTLDGGFTMFSSSNSFKTTNGNDLYLIRMDPKGVSQCNQKTGSGSNFGFTLKSGKFGKIRFGAIFNSISLTSKTVSNTFDSVLCCKLQAQMAAASLRVCKGQSVRLGKVAIPGYVYKWTQVGGSFKSTEANPLVTPAGSETYKLVVTSSDGKCLADSNTISVALKTGLTNTNFVRDTFFCFNGSVQITARSGMIDYNWKGKHVSSSGQTITVNKADTIILTVTDTTTCTYKDTMKVSMKQLPIFNLGNDTTICENTKITLIGPASMKSYNWNSGQATTQNFLTSEEKTHSLTVIDQFGCKFTDNKVIFNNPASTFSLGNDTSICEGLPYTINGPTFLTNFYWNGVSSFSANRVITKAGLYILQANNSFGCIHIDSIKIGKKQDPTFSLGPDGGVCASGGRILKGPSNVSKYKWDDGSTDSIYGVFFPGSYWLRVTGKNGCVFADTIKLVSVKNPIPELGKDTTICEKDSIYLDAGPFTSFKWSTGATTRIIKVKKAGLYEVTVKDNNGCDGIDDKSVKTKFCFINVKENAKIPGLKVYPVPASNLLHIEWLAKDANAILSIYDLNGKMVYSQEAYSGFGKYSVDVSQWSRGIYYLKVYSQAGEQSLKLELK